MDPNVESIIAKYRTRAEKGLRKYGVDTTRIDLLPAEWLQHLQDELMDAAVYAERLLNEPPAPGVAELEQEIEDGWHTLMNEYGTDNKCELLDEDTTIDQVKIRDGIQQLGEVAYQWRQERDDLQEEVMRLKAAKQRKEPE